MKFYLFVSVTTIFNICFGLCNWGPFGFYADVNLHIYEENCDARRGTEYQHCIDCSQKSKFFLLGNQHFLFPLACTCYISEWESASESLFLRNVFKGQILGLKFVHEQM